MIDSEIFKGIVVVFNWILLIMVFVTPLLKGKLMKNPPIYRLNYMIQAVMTIVGVPAMIIIDPQEEMFTNIFIPIYFGIVGIIVFLYNFNFFKNGEGELLTTTLVNCTVKKIRGGKGRQRKSYRIDGKSLEGNKDSFRLLYANDYKVIEMMPVTDRTKIKIQYYSNSYLVINVEREDDYQEEEKICY